MAKFRKKPVVIEAWHWLFSTAQEDSPSWVLDALNIWPAIGGINFEPDHPEGPRMSIATLEGVMIARPGDYIIQGVENELYPCKPDIFQQTYERVEEQQEMIGLKNGGPAFPISGIGIDQAGNNIVLYDGMTLRDYFAAKAMQAIIGKVDAIIKSENPNRERAIAFGAYAYADAMLAEKEKSR